CRRATPLARRRERLWLADGDFIDLDWHGPHDPSAPLVLILHGLTGSSRSHYVLGLQAQLATRGQTRVSITWRGCAGEAHRLPPPCHHGASDDRAAVAAHLQGTRPLAPRQAVGYSLGGNVLLKYLGEAGGTTPLHKAVPVSVPFRPDQ